MAASSRALEVQGKVSELERKNELQKKHIATLLTVVMRLKETVTLLKALTGKMENGRGERTIVLGLGWDPFPDRLILEQLRVVSMIV